MSSPTPDDGRVEFAAGAAAVLAATAECCVRSQALFTGGALPELVTVCNLGVEHQPKQGHFRVTMDVGANGQVYHTVIETTNDTGSHLRQHIQHPQAHTDTV